jgi:hypothetical protein
MLRLVHNPAVAIERVTIKYFEAGHTFMSADCEHATAGRKLRSLPTVLDIEDFAAAVTTQRVAPKLMEGTDFFHLKDDISTHQLNKLHAVGRRPYLKKVTAAHFRRASEP